MELSIIQIGNSKGFRLPKTLIEKYNIKDKVELILEKDIWFWNQFRVQDKDGKQHLKKWMRMEMINFFLMMYLKMKTLKNGTKAISNRPCKYWPYCWLWNKKTRPCVIISPNEMNKHLRTIIVAPMTTTSRKYPTRIEVK